MKRLILFFFLLNTMNIQAETWVYFENNTPLSFSVNTTQTGTHTLSPGEWNVSTSAVGAWEGQKELMWTNRNSGIHNGDDFFFDMVLTNGANSVTLKLKVTGTFTSSNMSTSASGLGFSHPWYSNNNFHQASFSWGGKSYTLKYHSYFTGGYDDVFFALHENDPYPISPADTTDPNTLNILAYNIYMLTPPIGNTDQTTRAAEIHKHVHGYDAIIISEAFYNSARSILQAGLAPEYPYMTAVVDNGILNDDGGVFIASRFPIISSSQIVYNDCNGSDCLAAKGVMHAEINKHGRVFHLFGTHTQAWPSAADVATRILQFKELQAFITSLNIPANEAVIIGGDLNVDMIANNLGEYDGMLDSLNLMEPTYTGHPYSYDGAISSYASPGVEFLDYVMTQNNHLSPLTAENEVLILRSIADDMFNMFDLSDHLAVRGRFVFPPLLSVDKMRTTTAALQSKVYPNPTSRNLTVSFGQLITGNIQVFNPLGVLVYEHKIDNKQQHKIDLGDLPKGIYYLNIKPKKHSAVLHKIVKVK